MNKTKVVIDEEKCDGCAKCVIACHEGVIKIVGGKAKVVNESSCDGLGACLGECPRGAITLAEGRSGAAVCGCPSVSVKENWPIQLRLVNPGSARLLGADLLLAADCVGFSLPGIQEALLKGKRLIILCPKLDQPQDEYRDKLTKIFRDSGVRSVTVAHMEVPCCFGLVSLARDCLAAAKKDIPLKEITVGIRR